MDEVTIIAVGIDAYEISTKPLIDSVRIHEPKTQIVIVDNVAPTPYTDARAEIVRLPERVCMAQAMNEGAKLARSKWLVFMNNDVICHGPFVEQIKALRPNAIYGNDPLNWWGRYWLDGWIMVMPRKVFDKVGGFDPNFIYAGFEDADYCFRAVEKGYKIQQHTFPFEHKELHSRFTMPGYMAQREKNIQYLCEKWGITR